MASSIEVWMPPGTCQHVLQLLLLLLVSECVRTHKPRVAPAGTFRTRLIGNVVIVGVSLGAKFERYSTTSTGIVRASVKMA